MESQLGQTPRARLLGWITLAAGSLNVLRPITEVVLLGHPWLAATYYVLAALKLLLGFLGIFSGLNLSRAEGSWGWRLGAAYWGAVLASSTMVLLAIYPSVVHVVRINPLRGEFLAIVPRLLFSVAALTAAPFVSHLFWLGPEGEGPSRRNIIGWGLCGFLGAGILCDILYPW